MQVILRHLVSGGLLVGDVECMLRDEMGAVFMPHGLGKAATDSCTCSRVSLIHFMSH